MHCTCQISCLCLKNKYKEWRMDIGSGEATK